MGRSNTALAARPLGVASPLYFNVLDYGAAGNGVTVSDAGISAGSASLTSASGLFSSSDVGKLVYISGAGAAGIPLVSTITAYTSSIAVTLSDTASTTVSGVEASWGTDSTDAIDEALSAAASTITAGRATGGGVVRFPASAGSYVSTGGHTIPWNVRVSGDVAQGSNIVHVGNNSLFTYGPDTTLKNYQRFRLSDLTIWGGAGTSAIGMTLSGKLWGPTFEHSVIGNYRNGVGLLLHNNASGDFAEGVILSDLSLRYNKTGVQLKRTSGDASFAYQRWLNFDIHVPASGIGIDIGSSSTGQCLLNDGRFDGNIWLEGNDAVAVNIGAYGDVIGSTEWNLRGEKTGSPTGTKALSIASGGKFSPRGVHDFINGPTMDVASATTFVPVTRTDERLQGQGIFAESFPRSQAQGASALTAGTAQGALIGLRRGQVVTNIVVVVSSNASSATLVKVGIKTTTGTLLASSADQKDLFNSGSTPRAIPVPLSAPFTVTDDGSYYLEILAVGGTPPTLLRGVNLAAACVAIGSGALPFEQSASSKTDIATYSVNATGIAFWFGAS